MRSFFSVETAADDLQLLSIEEMRSAAGVSGSGSDDSLQALGLAVAAAIAAECNVAIASGAQPTLLQETLEETFYDVCADELVLARRHDVDITSIVVDDTALDAADYLVDAEAGILIRLCDDRPVTWRGCKIVVTYDAGFETAPADLKMAATDFFRWAWREKDRDPSVRAERVDIADVEEREVSYWAGSLPGTGEGPVPEFVAGQLKRFRNAVV
jgi:hypothetical protein